MIKTASAAELPELPPRAEIERALDWTFETWSQQCHTVSLAIVKAGILPAGSRVARGFTDGVGGQHSWIVVGPGDGRLADCYADDAVIVDPTLWSYRSDVEGIWIGRADTSPYRHTPHGKGPNIFTVGRPDDPTGTPIPLAPETLLSLSARARHFLAILGPLDRRGWMQLAEMTVTGWPAAEIIRAMALTPGLAAYVPVDRIGMLTELDPEGLYGTTPGGRVQVGD